MQGLPLFLLLAGLPLVATAFPSHLERQGCVPPVGPSDRLEVRDGYMDFMDPAKLAPLKNALPVVDDSEIQAILKSPDTMWYDEESIVFGYQDSVGDPRGFRANCVGRKVGEDNAGSVIGKLMNLFGPDYRFYFPFRKAAGTDNVLSEKVLNFWSPPKSRGRALPVKVWRTENRGHYYWTFPIDTVIGEVLYQAGPGGNYYVFEIRTRKRYSDGWQVNLFRPFTTAKKLMKGIEEHRPDWAASINLRQVMNHLDNPNTLQPKKWESKPYAKVFPVINGSLDYIPEITDKSLVVDLLTQTPFQSAEGAIWKENATYQTYGPSSAADFGIAPKGYEAGLLPVNEVSCNRCHTEVSRALGEFEFDAVLYGEVWGEDRIFTWHPFKADYYIYQTWDETQGSRKFNPKMLQAGLILNQKPAAGEAQYKPLPSAFKPPIEGERPSH